MPDTIMPDTKKKEPVNPRGSGISKFVTDPKEDKWLERKIIPKLYESK